MRNSIFLIALLSVLVAVSAVAQQNALGVAVGRADASASTTWTRCRSRTTASSRRTCRRSSPSPPPAATSPSSTSAFVSPRIGAGLAFVQTRLDDTPLGDVDADGALTWLATAGADVHLGRRWAVTVDASYMPYAADFGALGETEMDPVTYTAGVKLRW